MDEKYNAICIRSVLWRESDKLVTLFTLENGKVDCVVRGAMSPKSKWRFAAEPFSFCEYVLKERAGKKTLAEATQIDGFFDIRYDIDRLYCASVVIEFIRQNVFEEMKCYDLFLITLNAMKAIEKGAYPHAALIAFLSKAFAELGYEAKWGSCSRCGSDNFTKAYYDFDAGAPVCEKCADTNVVEMRPSTLNYLKTACQEPFENLKNSDLSTYSPTFRDLKSTFFALKFLAYYMDVKFNCRLKSLSDLLDTFGEQ